ncbi:DUF309 domain-containing protein [Brevibacillus migulae]|uniref:DUF309 domain-containing protein n=1 Tax=Brevibacillus migulae TaxID=1644114 RepID=UPI00106E08F1|nr:DUF309 domain-containing protein [Brevibacillus migulae]
MYPHAYIAYLAHFHGDRDYFECHELLEEYWKSLPDDQRSVLWVGLIQIAVSLYHQRRGNFPGADKMMKSAIRILDNERPALARLGLDPSALIQQLKSKAQEIKQQVPYESINLPLTDGQLLISCKQWCEEHGMTFGQPSDLSEPLLIHRHTLRDRSEVIRERERSLLAKQQKQSLPDS